MKQIKRTPRIPGEVKPSDLWRTPPALFTALDSEFHFTIDLAANHHDHLKRTWFGPGAVQPSALTADWILENPGPGFCNPPYSSDLIKPFLAKAVLEARRGFTSVFLVPYTPDPVWWRQTAHAAEIREIPHRVPYLRADGVTKAGAMFASAILVFRPQPGLVRGDPRRVVWTYRDPEVTA